jgi:hypothetical protein
VLVGNSFSVRAIHDLIEHNNSGALTSPLGFAEALGDFVLMGSESSEHFGLFAATNVKMIE